MIFNVFGAQKSQVSEEYNNFHYSRSMFVITDFKFSQKSFSNS